MAIQQTLHGYQDGHRLLGGSVAISPEDRRRMLTLSDSPDAASLKDAESLLMGFPLPSEKFYVLAKTWAAPEVDRPGCVWTHSLLLDSEGLKAPSALDYLPLFRRPNTASDG